MTQDPHDRLLAKAFGDLDHRPFAWCFDEPSREPDDVDRYIASLPSEEQVEIHRLAAGPTSDLIATPAAALQEPREGETYISSWSELQYAMTHGQMGTPPQPLRRYEPQTTTTRRNCGPMWCVISMTSWRRCDR